MGALSVFIFLKHTTCDRFHGKIPTKKEPVRSLGFLPGVIYCYLLSVVVRSSKMAVNKVLYFQKYVANKDFAHEVINTLEEPIIARFIRIHPVTWYSHISMRFEFYGCYSGELVEEMCYLEYIFF